jgi:hypothetical protein
VYGFVRGDAFCSPHVPKLQVHTINAALIGYRALILLRKMVGDAGIEPATPPV